MRRIVFLFLIFAVSPVSGFAQTGPLREVLKRTEDHRKALRSLSADVTITKFSALFGGTYTKEGFVKFVPGANEYWLRIDSVKPASEIFLIVKNEYLVYLSDMKSASAGKLADSHKNTFAIFPFLSKGISKPDYNMRYIGQEKINGTTATWHIELAPKAESGVMTIHLWIDGNGMPLQSRVVENNGDWTTVALGNLKKNAEIKATDFKVDLPLGTKLNKN